jgi:N-acetylmuramoyl-L-alanine amidase
MGWVERFTSIAAGVAVMAAVSVMVARSDPAEVLPAATFTVATPNPTPQPPTTPPTTPRAVAKPTHEKRPAPVGAIATTGFASVRQHAGFGYPTLQILPPGVLLPVLAELGSFYKVMTPNEVIGWVHRSKAETTYAKAGAKPHSLKGATIVIDPGHGGSLAGAKGPTGLKEKDVNLGIAVRVIEKLTGARVFLTRDRGDAGLAYRSAIANRLHAHAFVSLHNNALPDRTNSKTPGTETYYQQGSKESKRLAGLIYEELAKVLARFNIEWGRDPFAGAKYRRGHKGHDYYAVLRRTLVPAVIVEGMFITNAPEEALLRRPEVREIYAKAVARGIKRFFTTDDPGSGFKDPYAHPTPQCKIAGCFEYRR